MVLLELCLLSLLSPQAPTAAPTPPVAAPATAPTDPATAATPQEPVNRAPEPGPAASDDLAALHRAEAAGKSADLEELVRLATGSEAAIAARAAWLLGRSEADGAAAALERAFASPHAGARVQVLATLLKSGDATTFPVAKKALDDDDRNVRALAAQLLGRLRRPQSAAPLLALLGGPHNDGREPGAAIDLQAAILALHDVGALDQLLPAASAVHNGKATGLGEALAYYFQDYSPQLPPKDETTLLLAVLDHKEPLLRRYAIGRLAELGDSSTATALERRLGSEGDELRPMIEATLTQLRAANAPPAQGGIDAARAKLDGLLAKGKQLWNGLDDNQRIAVGASPLAVMLLLFVVGKLRRRRATSASAAATAALVAPSDEFLAEQAEAAAAYEAEAALTAGEAAIQEFDDAAPAADEAWDAVTEDAENLTGDDRRR